MNFVFTRQRQPLGPGQLGPSAGRSRGLGGWSRDCSGRGQVACWWAAAPQLHGVVWCSGGDSDGRAGRQLQATRLDFVLVSKGELAVSYVSTLRLLLTAWMCKELFHVIQHYIFAIRSNVFRALLREDFTPTVIPPCPFFLSRAVTKWRIQGSLYSSSSRSLNVKI